MRDKGSREAWLFLCRTFLLVRTAIRCEFRETKLTSAQLDVIMALGTLGPVTQTELTEHLLVTKGNVSIVLKRLEREGIVRRKTPRENRRLNMVGLTDRGKTLYRDILERHEQKLSTLFSGITKREKKELVRTLEKLSLTIEIKKGG